MPLDSQSAEAGFLDLAPQEGPTMEALLPALFPPPAGAPLPGGLEPGVELHRRPVCQLEIASLPGGDFGGTPESRTADGPDAEDQSLVARLLASISAAFPWAPDASPPETGPPHPILPASLISRLSPAMPLRMDAAPVALPGTDCASFLPPAAAHLLLTYPTVPRPGPDQAAPVQAQVLVLPTSEAIFQATLPEEMFGLAPAGPGQPGLPDPLRRLALVRASPRPTGQSLGLATHNGSAAFFALHQPAHFLGAVLNDFTAQPGCGDIVDAVIVDRPNAPAPRPTHEVFLARAGGFVDQILVCVGSRMPPAGREATWPGLAGPPGPVQVSRCWDLRSIAADLPGPSPRGFSFISAIDATPGGLLAVAGSDLGGRALVCAFRMSSASGDLELLGFAGAADFPTRLETLPQAAKPAAARAAGLSRSAGEGGVLWRVPAMDLRPDAKRARELDRLVAIRRDLPLPMGALVSAAGRKRARGRTGSAISSADPTAGYFLQCRLRPLAVASDALAEVLVLGAGGRQLAIFATATATDGEHLRPVALGPGDEVATAVWWGRATALCTTTSGGWRLLRLPSPDLDSPLVGGTSAGDSLPLRTSDLGAWAAAAAAAAAASATMAMAVPPTASPNAAGSAILAGAGLSAIMPYLSDMSAVLQSLSLLLSGDGSPPRDSSLLDLAPLVSPLLVVDTVPLSTRPAGQQQQQQQQLLLAAEADGQPLAHRLLRLLQGLLFATPAPAPMSPALARASAAAAAAAAPAAGSGPGAPPREDLFRYRVSLSALFGLTLADRVRDACQAGDFDRALALVQDEGPSNAGLRDAVLGCRFWHMTLDPAAGKLRGDLSAQAIQAAAEDSPLARDIRDRALGALTPAMEPLLAAGLCAWRPVGTLLERAALLDVGLQLTAGLEGQPGAATCRARLLALRRRLAAFQAIVLGDGPGVGIEGGASSPGRAGFDPVFRAFCRADLLYCARRLAETGRAASLAGLCTAGPRYTAFFWPFRRLLLWLLPATADLAPVLRLLPRLDADGRRELWLDAPGPGAGAPEDWAERGPAMRERLTDLAEALAGLPAGLLAGRLTSPAGPLSRSDMAQWYLAFGRDRGAERAAPWEGRRVLGFGVEQAGLQAELAPGRALAEVYCAVTRGLALAGLPAPTGRLAAGWSYLLERPAAARAHWLLRACLGGALRPGSGSGTPAPVEQDRRRRAGGALFCQLLPDLLAAAPVDSTPLSCQRVLCDLLLHAAAGALSQSLGPAAEIEDRVLVLHLLVEMPRNSAGGGLLDERAWWRLCLAALLAETAYSRFAGAPPNGAVAPSAATPGGRLSRRQRAAAAAGTLAPSHAQMLADAESRLVQHLALEATSAIDAAAAAAASDAAAILPAAAATPGQQDALAPLHALAQRIGQLRDLSEVLARACFSPGLTGPVELARLLGLAGQLQQACEWSDAPSTCPDLDPAMAGKILRTGAGGPASLARRQTRLVRRILQAVNGPVGPVAGPGPGSSPTSAPGSGQPQAMAFDETFALMLVLDEHLASQPGWLLPAAEHWRELCWVLLTTSRFSHVREYFLRRPQQPVDWARCPLTEEDQVALCVGAARAFFDSEADLRQGEGLAKARSCLVLAPAEHEAVQRERDHIDAALALATAGAELSPGVPLHPGQLAGLRWDPAMSPGASSGGSLNGELSSRGAGLLRGMAAGQGSADAAAVPDHIHVRRLRVCLDLIETTRGRAVVPSIEAIGRRPGTTGADAGTNVWQLARLLRLDLPAWATGEVGGRSDGSCTGRSLAAWARILASLALASHEHHFDARLSWNALRPLTSPAVVSGLLVLEPGDNMMPVEQGAALPAPRLLASRIPDLRHTVATAASLVGRAFSETASGSAPSAMADRGTGPGPLDAVRAAASLMALASCLAPAVPVYRLTEEEPFVWAPPEAASAVSLPRSPVELVARGLLAAAGPEAGASTARPALVAGASVSSAVSQFRTLAAELEVLAPAGSAAGATGGASLPVYVPVAGPAASSAQLLKPAALGDLFERSQRLNDQYVARREAHHRTSAIHRSFLALTGAQLSFGLGSALQLHSPSALLEQVHAHVAALSGQPPSLSAILCLVPLVADVLLGRVEPSSAEAATVAMTALHTRRVSLAQALLASCRLDQCALLVAWLLSMPGDVAHNEHRHDLLLLTADLAVNPLCQETDLPFRNRGILLDMAGRQHALLRVASGQLDTDILRAVILLAGNLPIAGSGESQPGGPVPGSPAELPRPLDSADLLTIVSTFLSLSYAWDEEG
ncbi:hypothetical protein H696_02402 [Fonticula alba]|uniref:Uncharacterized protein n=1 Tax=Fonticula alba TaxID=691883 RepID=A0A058ZC04_FONAL|nr:hypothetical protein H696_02402 [Fonticula alba]KCV71456.1 hypothetical protein H696_02402 [Fonticula alba]|eukprot:XP_009494579.1 hypothetical protein H696_02402 [Fonticula alba]